MRLASFLRCKISDSDYKFKARFITPGAYIINLSKNFTMENRNKSIARLFTHARPRETMTGFFIFSFLLFYQMQPDNRTIWRRRIGANAPFFLLFIFTKRSLHYAERNDNKWIGKIELSNLLRNNTDAGELSQIEKNFDKRIE